MSRPVVFLVALVVGSLVPCLSAQDSKSKTNTVYDVPKTCPAKIEFRRWSGELNVPDPVAISFDNQGRAFVTQTQRRKSQDLDIRQNTDWIPNDLGFRSVKDKRDFYHRTLSPETDGKRRPKQRVQDLNKDGSRDWRDLMMISEKIRIFEDTDGNGTADRANLYAEDFKTEVTGIAAGVLAHSGDVYATIAPDVWRLTDTNGDGKANKREVMATGFGVHIAYAGHDMHGLTVGPDGKMYWSVGDKGISVMSKEGRKYLYPNQGGVMRCNPDGTDFEVFAHGLRNVQELAFDQFGNLFSIDNDADMPTERERFVYIVPGMDAGWRCNYQYRGDDYNPWTDEKLWQLWHPQQPSYIIPPIKHSLNGPAGFAFNPGTALSPAYRDYFFVTGAPNGEQRAFQVKQNGASFEMINEHEFARGKPIVGINFGPDGALYGVDWGGGYPLNQSGAIWSMDVPGAANSKERSETKQRLASGFKSYDDPQLPSLLSHADQRIRLGAQFELVSRSQGTNLALAARDSKSQLARIHAIWGLGQLVRSKGITDSGDLTRKANAYGFGDFLKDPEPEIRTQALRTIADFDHFEGEQLVPLLNDLDERVRFHAALAVRHHPTSAAQLALLKLAEQLSPENTYMRHAIAMGLSGTASRAELTALHKHKSPPVRLTAVLALRELSANQPALDRANRSLSYFLADKDNHVATEAALAIYEAIAPIDLDSDLVPADLTVLAATIPDNVRTNESFARRAIGAAYMIGTPAHAEQLARFAARTDVSIALRLDALDALSQWLNPPPLDRVDGRRRRLKPNRSVRGAGKLATLLGSLLADTNKQIPPAALNASRNLKLPITGRALDSLAELLRSSETDPALRVESLNTLAAEKYVGLDDLLQLVLKSRDVQLRKRGRELLVSRPDAAMESIGEVLAGSAKLHERQHAIALLGKVGTDQADQTISDLLSKLIAGKAAPGTELDILEAAEMRRDNAAIAGQLKQIDTKRASNDPLIAYSECLIGGDVQAGRTTFNTHIEAQCARCHRVGKNGSTVGPNLQSIGRTRDTKHLLRAIVAPSADIEPKYRTQTIILDSGKSISGVLVRKNDSTTVLADNQGKEITINNDEIDDAVEQNISIMPDMTKALSRREIRDLVAYLQSLRKK